MEIPKINQKPRQGSEPLHDDGQSLDVSVLDFWRWSASDLLSNATRGIFAEFIIATALCIPLDEVRDEWGPFDLLTPEGIKVEVKSSGYIQSWFQKKPTVISYGVPKTRGWNPETNLLDTEARRQADVYVFALLAHLDYATIDPLNIGQWRFYVLPTAVLDNRERSQHSITLRSLEELSGGSLSYGELRAMVLLAYERHISMNKKQ
ncbi:MAG: hypothetical protein IT173_04090 [Acidobacteria bacterium]|nr:hypothetical protein [Acidobacteriota bacterium]